MTPLGLLHVESPLRISARFYKGLRVVCILYARLLVYILMRRQNSTFGTNGELHLLELSFSPGRIIVRRFTYGIN